MKVFQIEVITPSKTAYSGTIQSVTIPGTAGSFQILYNHAPLISTFEIGKIKIVDETGKELIFATSGGTVEVKNNKVIVLAETFESPSEIILERAKNAMERAKQRLHDRSNKNIDVIRAESALARAVNRISVAQILK